MSDETITISVEELDALIERKMMEKIAAARAPQRGLTPGCNCKFEGYLDKAIHQFGCPFAGQRKRHEELFG